VTEGGAICSASEGGSTLVRSLGRLSLAVQKPGEVNPKILMGGVAAWFSRVISIVLGLLLLPVLFRHLPNPELGLWMLCGQTWIALSIFDFGFGVVLTRRIAFEYSQAKSRSSGTGAALHCDQLMHLVATGHRLYAVLATAAFVTSFIGGAWYARSLHLAAECASSFWIVWGLLCFGRAFGIWTTVSSCVLQGLGYVSWDILLAATVNAMTLILQIVVVVAGFGLIGLAVVATVGMFLQRTTLIWFLRRRQLDLIVQRGKWKRELFRSMLSPALRAWLTSLGYLMVANTDALFIASFDGTSAIPAYRAAFVLVINLHLIAGVFSAATPAFVSQLWEMGEISKIRSIVRQNASIGLWTMACGAGAILSLGPTLFHWWLGPNSFIGYPVLIMFLVTFGLEHHANVFSTCARATDDEAYGLSSIGTGMIKLLLALVFTRQFGLPGLAASTLVAQLAINNWYMPYRSSLRLRIKLAEHARCVLVPCAALFATVLVVGLAAQRLLSDCAPASRVLTVSIIGIVLLTSALWTIALESSQQLWVLRRIGLR
jgi:O-antigen/teichoic acid export membrane protein